MRTIAKLTCTTIAVAALFGLSGMTAMAGAEQLPAAAASVSVAPEGDEMNAEATRGFDVTNLSSRTLVLDNVLGSSGWPITDKAPVLSDDEFPAKGSVLAPGQSMHFEVHAWGDNHGLTAHFRDPQQAGEVRVYLHVSGVSRYSTVKWPFGELSDGGGQVTLYDPAGTTINLSAGQAQAQADVLKGLCGNSNATCTFKLTSVKEFTGPEHPIGFTSINNTPDSQTSQISTKETVGVSDSVGGGISVKGNILGMVETAVNANWTHTWTKTQEFGHVEDLTVRPYYKGWMTVKLPMVRTTGDFTVKMAGTTWNLSGISFDTPSHVGGLGTLSKHAVPMTAEEIAALPKDLTLAAPGNGDIL
jgi:hypothetical protein